MASCFRPNERERNGLGAQPWAKRVVVLPCGASSRLKIFRDRPYQKAMLVPMWRFITRRGSAALAFVLATASVHARVPEAITISNVEISATPKPIARSKGEISASPKPIATSNVEISAAQEVEDLLASLTPDCSAEGIRCIDGATLRVEAGTRLKISGLVPLQLGKPGGGRRGLTSSRRQNDRGGIGPSISRFTSHMADPLP
jgi:hypothetical protein